VFSSSSKPEQKVVCSEIGNAQLASSSQPSVLEHVHSKEADTLAISDLNRALDKKVFPDSSQSLPLSRYDKRKYLCFKYSFL